MITTRKVIVGIVFLMILGIIGVALARKYGSSDTSVHHPATSQSTSVDPQELAQVKASFPSAFALPSDSEIVYTTKIVSGSNETDIISYLSSQSPNDVFAGYSAYLQRSGFTAGNPVTEAGGNIAIYAFQTNDKNVAIPGSPTLSIVIEPLANGTRKVDLIFSK